MDAERARRGIRASALALVGAAGLAAAQAASAEGAGPATASLCAQLMGIVPVASMLLIIGAPFGFVVGLLVAGAALFRHNRATHNLDIGRMSGSTRLFILLGALLAILPLFLAVAGILFVIVLPSAMGPEACGY